MHPGQVLYPVSLWGTCKRKATWLHISFHDSSPSTSLSLSFYQSQFIFHLPSLYPCPDPVSLSHVALPRLYPELTPGLWETFFCYFKSCFLHKTSILPVSGHPGCGALLFTVQELVVALHRHNWENVKIGKLGLERRSSGYPCSGLWDMSMSWQMRHESKRTLAKRALRKRRKGIYKAPISACDRSFTCIP